MTNHPKTKHSFKESILLFVKKVKSSKLFLPLIIAAGVFVAAIAGFYLYKLTFPDNNSQSAVVSTSETSIEIVDTVEEPATKLFQSKEHNITFEYPVDWSAEETVDIYSTIDSYFTSIKINNHKDEYVARLAIGGQIGGLCPEEAPEINVYSDEHKTVSIIGLSDVSFGYSITELEDGQYGLTFGLSNEKFAEGDRQVRCPGISVMYAYIPTSHLNEIGLVSFGIYNKLFTSLREAQDYTKSDEYKQISTMIKSLSIKVIKSANDYLNIPEWGIKINMRDAEKVQYKYEISDGSAEPFGWGILESSIRMSIKDGELNDPSCNGSSVSMLRLSTYNQESQRIVKKIGDYYFTVSGSPYVCYDEEDNALGSRVLNDFSIDNIIN